MSSLISLPLRLGVRTARASLQATRDLADLGLATLELLGRKLGEEPPADDFEFEFEGDVDFDVDVDVDLERPSEPHRAEPAPPREPPRPVEVPSPPPPAPARPMSPPLVPDTAVDIGLEPEEHSPDERELVEEFADAGAEDGAGASLRIAPPFDGYDDLRAPDVIARLLGADAAELGETELYERTHRARRTVLDAIARELHRRDRT